MPANGYTLEELEAEIALSKKLLDEFRSALDACSDRIKKINPDFRAQITELHKILDERGALLDQLLTAGRKYLEALQAWHRTTERS